MILYSCRLQQEALEQLRASEPDGDALPNSEQNSKHTGEHRRRSKDGRVKSGESDPEENDHKKRHKHKSKKDKHERRESDGSERHKHKKKHKEKDRDRDKSMDGSRKDKDRHRSKSCDSKPSVSQDRDRCRSKSRDSKHSDSQAREEGQGDSFHVDNSLPPEVCDTDQMMENANDAGTADMTWEEEMQFYDACNNAEGEPEPVANKADSDLSTSRSILERNGILTNTGEISSAHENDNEKCLDKESSVLIHDQIKIDKISSAPNDTDSVKDLATTASDYVEQESKTELGSQDNETINNTVVVPDMKGLNEDQLLSLENSQLEHPNVESQMSDNQTKETSENVEMSIDAANVPCDQEMPCDQSEFPTDRESDNFGPKVTKSQSTEAVIQSKVTVDEPEPKEMSCHEKLSQNVIPEPSVPNKVSEIKDTEHVDVIESPAKRRRQSEGGDKTNDSQAREGEQLGIKEQKEVKEGQPSVNEGQGQAGEAQNINAQIACEAQGNNTASPSDSSEKVVCRNDEIFPVKDSESPNTVDSVKSDVNNESLQSEAKQEEENEVQNADEVPAISKDLTTLEESEKCDSSSESKVKEGQSKKKSKKEGKVKKVKKDKSSKNKKSDSDSGETVSKEIVAKDPVAKDSVAKDTGDGDNKSGMVSMETAEEDTWESLFDEDGEALDSKLMDEVCTGLIYE